MGSRVNTCSTHVRSHGRSVLNPAICNLRSAPFSCSHFNRGRILERPLTIRTVTTENPSVSRVMLNAVSRLAGDEAPVYLHRSEGPDSFTPSAKVLAVEKAVAFSARSDGESHGPPANQGGSRGGSFRFAQFASAPESVQREFEQRIAAEVAADSDSRRYRDEVDDDDPVPPRLPKRQPSRRPTIWNEAWRRRAQAMRRPNGQAKAEEFEDQRRRLKALNAAYYIEVLTGEAVRGGLKLRCVLPDHDERTGSMTAYPDDGGWYCFGCGKGGSVYELASELWGLQLRGPQFMEIHKRLCAIFEEVA